MPRATTLTRRAAVKAERIVDAITLDHHARDLGTGALRADGGLVIDLALANPVTANDGDALKLEDGALVLVRAAMERVLEVRAENPVRLLRAALLAGGAHAVAEAETDAFYILPHDALAEAIRGLGCAVTPVERAFSPERAAVHDCCGHDHGHDHDHAHAHHHGHDDHQHGHDHHAHAQPHDGEKAGRGCGCGHDHHDHDHHHDHGHDQHKHGHT